MDNLDDERVLRIILFRQDFIEAINYFEAAKSTSNELIRNGLIKVAIITYAKPFMKNTGINKEANNYRLPKEAVPDETQWLHEILMDLRGNFIGHSNFKLIKPTISKLVNTPKGKMHHIQYTHIDFDSWFKENKESQEDTLLIDQTIKLINAIIADIPAPYSTKDVFQGAIEC